MKGKKVKDSSLVTSHLMLIGDAGNMIIDKDSMPIGMVHGGKIMTLMDEIAGMVGARPVSYTHLTLPTNREV